MKNISIADILKPELRTELEARLAEFEENPEAGFSWEQVKSCFNTMAHGVLSEVFYVKYNPEQ